MRSTLVLSALLIPMTATMPLRAMAQPTDSIVVTATRQSRTLDELAGNDSLIDQDRITSTQAGRPAELLNQLAGIGIEQGGGEEEIAAIRSPALNGGAGQGSVLLLEDGVPLRAAGFGNVNGLYEANAEQSGAIEVVRGPGSALYGSNAVHGLINFIPRAPSQDFSGDVTLLGGSFGTYQSLASISADQTRLSAEEHHESGWRDGSRLDEQKYALRDVWQNGADRLTTTLSGQNLNQRTAAYITGKDSYLDYPLDKTNPIPTAYRQADSARAMLRWQHDVSDDLQFSVTPYTRYTEMNFLMFYLPSQAIQANAHYSVGLQSALYCAIAGGNSLILGLDLDHTDGWYSEFQNRASFTQGGNLYPYGLHYDLNVGANVVAPYLHSEWQLADDLRLTAGLRLEETAYDYTDKASVGLFGLFQRPADRSDHFATVTPKLGLVRQWFDAVSSYFNLARGARAPQVTDLYELQNRQQVGQVKSESLDSAEIGSRLHRDGFSLAAQAYWMEKSHYFYRAADGSNVPDGKTLHRGVEIEGQAPLPADFTLAVAASYAEHLYAFNRPDATIISSVSKGGTIPNAPRDIANVRLAHGFGREGHAELEWVHMGSYFTDNADTHAYGGHELFNARFAAPLNQRVRLQAKVTNLADRRYADRASITTTGIDEYFPGAPRSFYAGLAADF